MTHRICDECETVAHCSKNGCIPKVPVVGCIEAMKQALEALEEAVEELGGKVCEKCEDAIEVLKATLNGLDELECHVCHRRAYPYPKCGCVTYVERGEA